MHKSIILTCINNKWRAVIYQLYKYGLNYNKEKKKYLNILLSIILTKNTEF